MLFTRWGLTALYFGGTQVTLQDEHCLHQLPLGAPAIGIMDYTVWNASNFEFTPPAGTCGTSFVNSGNHMSCFELQGGVCRTAFPTSLASSPPYLFIHVNGVGDDVTVSRSPFGSENQPQLRRSLPTEISDPGGAFLDVVMELEATRRCVAYPPVIIDFSGQTWTRLSQEVVGSDVLSALYSSHRAVAGDVRESWNATHDFFRAAVGGGLLDANTDFTYARLKGTLPPARPPGSSDAVILMATLIPLGVVIGATAAAYLAWKLGHSKQ